MKKLSLLLAIIVLMCACETESSDEVTPSSVYQSYAFTYDKSLDKTYALAEFRDGGPFGNDIVLVSPAQAIFNGDLLHYQAIPWDLIYYHYGKEYDGVILTGTYVYTESDGKAFANIVDMTGMEIDFQTNHGLDTISKSTDLVFTWSGAAVANGETVELSFNVFNDTTTMISKSTSEAGDVSITFTTADFSTLATGKCELVLERYKSPTIQSATSTGGSMSVTYYTSLECIVKD